MLPYRWKINASRNGDAMDVRYQETLFEVKTWLMGPPACEKNTHMRVFFAGWGSQCVGCSHGQAKFSVLVRVRLVPFQTNRLGDLIELFATDFVQLLAFGFELLVDLDS